MAANDFTYKQLIACFEQFISALNILQANLHKSSRINVQVGKELLICCYFFSK